LTLFRSQDPLSRIAEAPEYDAYVITGYNISKESYIGDSHRSRDELMGSDIYITISEKMVKNSPSSFWNSALYIGLGIAAGFVIVVTIRLLCRRIPRRTALTSKFGYITRFYSK
jgi:hypothetical protein